MVSLWATGQTINIMTLGGLALAVGVLVDEATVAIENIHTHMRRRYRARARWCEASPQTAVPRLLSMLCILAVFVPSFFMIGVARQLFVPLSLAVGFAMVSSYLLVQHPGSGVLDMVDSQGASRRRRERSVWTLALVLPNVTLKWC